MDDIGPEPSYEDIIRKEVASIRQEHNLPDTDVETSDLSSQVFVEYSSRRDEVALREEIELQRKESYARRQPKFENEAFLKGILTFLPFSNFFLSEKLLNHKINIAQEKGLKKEHIPWIKKTSKRVKIIETRRNSKERKLKEIRDKLQRICKTKLITNKQFFVLKSFEKILMLLLLFEVYIRVLKFKIRMEKKKQKELKKEAQYVEKMYEEWTVRDIFCRHYVKDVVCKDLSDRFSQSEPLDLSAN